MLATDVTQASIGTARHGWRILALWALVAAAYSNSWHAGLVFDSAPVIQDDPRIHAATADNVGEIFSGPYWYHNSASGLYRPLTTLSYLVNYAVLGDGPRPEGYHAVNLALHLINVALVYALGIAIFGEIGLAWALAALWGVHPLLTEAVTNIVGRADLLAARGVLAGLLCYIRSTTATGKVKAAWLAAMVAAQTVGLFSKESAAVLPTLLLLYDLTFGQPGGWRRRVPAYAALLLPFAAFFYLRGAAHTHLRIAFLENPLIGAGFWVGRLTAIGVLGKLTWLFVWPVHLSADYSYNAVPVFAWKFGWAEVQTLVAMAVLLGAVLLAFRWRRTYPAVCFFIAFFFVAAAPTANLAMPIGSIMAERFLYLASIGLAGCAIAALTCISHRTLRFALWRRLFSLPRRLSSRRMEREPLPQHVPARVPRRQPKRLRHEQLAQCRLKGDEKSGLSAFSQWRGWRPVWMAASVAILLLAVRTHARNLDWSDEESLWTSAVSVCPGAARPHNNLGNALAQSPGRLPEAIAEFRTALRILPSYADAHYNLGNALAQVRGRLPEAMAEYRAALAVDPDYARAHLNLGTALTQMPGRMPEALVELQAAVRLEPESAEAHYDLANVLAQTPGRVDDAISEYRAVLRIDPGYAKAHNNLGTLLSQLPARLGDAIDEYRAALRSEPGYTKAHNNLGNALARVPGHLGEAIAEYQAALRSDPQFADAHYNLGVALARLPERRADAIAELETARRIAPNPETERALDWLRKK